MTSEVPEPMESGGAVLRSPREWHSDPNGQLDLFGDGENFRFRKKIRLIELFAGYGSQRLALDYLHADYESWRICEWAIPSIIAYAMRHASFRRHHCDNRTKREVARKLACLGVSKDYSHPATEEELCRMDEEKLKLAYDSIVETNNLVDISKAHGKDFLMEGRENYNVMLTYSFPCQDLSLAGELAGMNEQSGTRSSLVWQVMRILKEMKEEGQLPDVLVMENVPNVCGKKNISDFMKIISFLDGLGYHSSYQILSAVDYGIPQVRKRCFMVSVLDGEGGYEFPKPFRLTWKLRDFLEGNIDPKIQAKRGENQERRQEEKAIMVPEATKKGFKQAMAGDCIYTNRPWQKRGTVQKGKAQMITCAVRHDIAVVVGTPDRKVDGKYYLSNAFIRTFTTNKFLKGKKVVNKDNAEVITTKADRQTMPVVSEAVGDNTDVMPIIKEGNGDSDWGFLRLRKLTPKECFRLMGVKDSDFAKLASYFSDGILYHLAGDSIVVDVLMAVFAKMIGKEEA